jgi:tetratricopeptide (TPR) repeat protein
MNLVPHTMVLRLLAAGLLGLAAFSGAAAQEATEPKAPPATRAPAEPPSLESLLKPPAKDAEVSRREVLADLFERLHEAPDEDSAALVAGAIEKIWKRSGSDTVDLLMNRANALMEKEELDLALDILDSVVAMAPDYSEGWSQRATVFFLKRQYDRSLDDLRSVLALEPRHFKAINGLGLIMQELGDKKAALRAFRKVLELYPQLPDTQRLEKELAREIEGQDI